MNSASRRRPPPPRRGSGRYAGQPAYQPDYQPDYDYPPDYAYEPDYAYGADYDYGPQDGWWDEGTGGMFSPVRVLLFLVVLGAGAAAFYGLIIDKTPLQIPISVGGLAVLGLALVLLGFSSARGAASLGRRGHGGKALLAALFGGLCVAGGLGSLAGAIVLGMLALSA